MKSTTPTNYCTFFFDGTWAECCWAHDEDCLMALECLSPKKRLESDIKLYYCVSRKVGPLIAFIMYLGVRLWASSFWWINYLSEKYKLNFSL